MSNPVLIIGDAKVGKRFLVRELVQAEIAPKKFGSVGIESLPLALDTKYYSALLDLMILPAATHASFVESEDATLRTEFDSIQPEALILLFSLSRPDSFHSIVSAWKGYITEKNPQVMLLVGNISEHTLSAATSSPASSPPVQSAIDELEQLAKDWALDHQIEYVRLPHNDTLKAAHTRLATPTTTATVPSRSDDDDDIDLSASNEPIGLARIRESLECNQWGELMMKDRKQMKYMQGEAMDIKNRNVDGEEMTDEEREAAAFAHMQREAQTTNHTNSDEDGYYGSGTKLLLNDNNDEDEKRRIEEAVDQKQQEFEEFVSAMSAATVLATTAASTTSKSDATSSAPVSASTSTAASTKKPTKSTASSSASAFANAFANAIRVPETKPQSSTKPKSTTTAPAKSTSTPTTAAVPAAQSASSTSEPIDRPMSTDEIDALAKDLEKIASAPVDPSTADAPVDDASLETDGVKFDQLFEKITQMRTQLNQTRADGTKLSDEERRAKAEENLKMLLKSMGMEGELDSDVDEEA